MICHSALPYRRAFLRAVAGGLVVVAAACGGDGVGPTSESTLPGRTPGDTVVTTPGDSAGAPTDTSASAPSDSGRTNPDSTVIPPDSTAPPPTDSTTGLPPATDPASVAPGILFGSNSMPTTALSSVHTGTLLGGPIGPSNILSVLSQTRAKGGRIVMKLSMGRDQYIKNADGTFSFTKWKGLVDRFKSINFGPYIADGTILGHYLIDEPQRAVRWGGKIIPQTTIEAMAAYSKQLWPGMTTFARVAPSWLASSPVAYRSLDAGWLQYAAGKGTVSSLVTSEVGAAKSKGLGLVVGLNVLAGGNGSSGIKGYWGSNYAMSASEIRTYGTTLLNQSYACGFYMWMYDSGYYGRSDIKSAMAELSTKAKAHAKTSCKQ